MTINAHFDFISEIGKFIHEIGFLNPSENFNSSFFEKVIKYNDILI